MHQLRMSPLKSFCGWTKIPSSLPACIFFFHLFFSPKFCPLLPTTYLPPPTNPQPPPPTSHPHSIARAPKPLSGREPGAGAVVVELERAWSWSCWSRGVEAGTGAGPTRDLVNILSFFLFVCFICSYFSCGAALQQLSIAKKATSTMLPLPSSSSCGVALQHSVAKKATTTTLPSPSSSSSRATLQRLLLPLLELRCSIA